MRVAVQLFAGSVDFRAGPEIYVAVRPGLQTLARLVRGASIQGPSRKWGTAIWLCCRAVKSQVGGWRSTERLVVPVTIRWWAFVYAAKRCAHARRRFPAG